MRLLAALALCLSFSTHVQAQAPAYSLASVVDAASSVPGRLSPNSHGAVYGTNLSDVDRSSIHVRIDRREVPITYASRDQVNFIVPGNTPLGSQVSFYLIRAGVTGPELFLSIRPAAPEFFLWPSSYVLAARPDGSLVVPEKPAAPGEIVVLYANGLGATRLGESQTLTPARYADAIAAKLEISLDDRPVPPENLLYAGVAPGFVALYQINLRLPADSGPNPVIRMGLPGEPPSRAGTRLAVSGNAVAP